MNIRAISISTVVLGTAAACDAQVCTQQWQQATFAPDNGVHALLARADTLYVGGAFEFLGGIQVHRIGAIDALGVTPLGAGFDWPIHGLFGCCARVYTIAFNPTPIGPQVFAGGEFIGGGGTLFESAAIYESFNWQAMADGLLNNSCPVDCGPRVYASLIAPGASNTAIYIAGTFTDSASGVPMSRVGRWENGAWHDLAGGLTAPKQTIPYWGEALALYDDGRGEAVYVGGQFTHAGGIPADSIARWDGAAWEPLAQGLGPNNVAPYAYVKAMTVWNGSLYVGGEFTLAGSTKVSNLARWDGTSWHDVGGGTDAQILALAVHDDGSGESLFVGGQFASAGAVPASRIAAWNGSAWRALQGGVDGDVQTMTTYNDGTGEHLYVGGWFNFAGGASTPYLAKWARCPAPQCYPDCDASGSLDFFDFLCFQNAFATGLSYADCDASGSLDFFDFLCFQNLFAAGCP